MLVGGAQGRLMKLVEGRVVTATKEVPPDVGETKEGAEKGEVRFLHAALGYGGLMMARIWNPEHHPPTP